MEQIINKAITIISKDLGLNTMPEVRYLRNHQEGTFGMICESVPDVIFLDIPQIDKYHENELLANFCIFETLCHEARHLWQIQEGWKYDHDMDYTTNPCEIDANKYAESVVGNLIEQVLLDVA